MTDRPIIFSGPMVQALIEGRKTQTRRLATSPLRRCERGDRLYVRENFWWKRDSDREVVNWAVDFEWAGGAQFQRERGMRLRPSIHMPRWASRLTLIVENVRFQRLDEISEDDAVAEGCGAGQLDDGFAPRDLGGGWTISSPGTYCSAAGAYFLLWQKLHPEWDGFSDVDVVALTFRVVHENINRMRL